MRQRSPVITSKPTLCLDSWFIWGDGYVLSTSLPLMTQPCPFSVSLRLLYAHTFSTQLGLSRTPKHSAFATFHVIFSL